MNKDELYQLFLAPPTTFRSAPFWSWNDKLEEEELARQISEMKDKGMGGFFMHSRSGLETGYLSEEWMNCVKAAVEAAGKNEVSAWLYDEDRWPSGVAAGKVVEKGGDAFRAKALTLEIIKEDYTPDYQEKNQTTSQGENQSKATVIALYRGEIREGRLLSCNRLNPKKSWRGEEGKVLLAVWREISGPSTIFHDEAPSDNLCPEAVDTFLESTYDAYKGEVGEEFGKAIPGIFTDEPCAASCQCAYTPGRGWLPWTDGFERYFEERRGYDLLEILPLIFFEGEKTSKARHDYWRTVFERFCEAYTQRLSQWCKRNGLQFTGHFLDENELGAAARQSGATMPHYKYMDVPGIDLLGTQIDEVMAVKQCTSVANQFGKSRVITETYGGTGWSFDYEGQKWIGDWQYVMGVNLRCQHLVLYSLKGCRKRDYPPSFNYHTPWWKDNGLIEDYFARLGAVLSQGRPVRDVLVLHPSTTAWSRLGCSPKKAPEWWSDTDPDPVNAYGAEFNMFLKTLLSHHHDFDLGDETLMEEAASVKGMALCVGSCEYKLVIIPQVDTLLGSTLDLLQQFLDAGGKVIWMGNPPFLAEGEPSQRPKEVFAHPAVIHAADSGEALKCLDRAITRRVGLCDERGEEVPEFYCMLRELEGYSILFIVNTDRKVGHEAEIRLDFAGSVEEWDPCTGKSRNRDIQLGQNMLHFREEFPPAGSRLYVVDRRPKPLDQQWGQCDEAEGQNDEVPLKNREPQLVAQIVSRFSFDRTLPNALVLDRCKYRIAGGPWSDVKDILVIQREIRDGLGFYNGGVQRYKWAFKPHPADGARVELLYEFTVEDVPGGEVCLVLEDAADFTVTLNGEVLSNRPEGYFLDRSFRKIRLSQLKQGTNRLVLGCDYRNRSELESCYLIGNFGVDAVQRIVREPELLESGDWSGQGYPHYCGSMVYHFEYDHCLPPESRIFLDPGDYKAVSLTVRVNGAPAGTFLWKSPQGIEITRHLVQGCNQIEIEVMGSPRNLLGPLHHLRENESWVDPGAFEPRAEEYVSGPVLKPFGLWGPVRIFQEILKRN